MQWQILHSDTCEHRAASKPEFSRKRPTSLCGHLLQVFVNRPFYLVRRTSGCTVYTIYRYTVSVTKLTSVVIFCRGRISEDLLCVCVCVCISINIYIDIHLIKNVHTHTHTHTPPCGPCEVDRVVLEIISDCVQSTPPLPRVERLCQ